MPLLQHKLTRNVLKFEQEVVITEQPSDDVCELSIHLIVKIGENGKLQTEPRLQQRNGPLSAYTEPFLRADERDIAPTGISLDGAAFAALDFLPLLPEEDKQVGDTWKARELGPAGQDAEASYELASWNEGDPRAEIISRKLIIEPGGRRTEVETLYDFSIRSGRVMSAQSVIEIQPGPAGRSVRILAELKQMA